MAGSASFLPILWAALFLAATTGLGGPSALAASLQARQADGGRETARPDVLFDPLDSEDTGLLPAALPDDWPYQAGYVDGEYFITVPDAGYESPAVVSIPGGFGDVDVSVDTRLVGPTAWQYLTLSCRVVADEEHVSEYRLSVSPARRLFALGRLGDGEYTPLVDWRTSLAIAPGAEPNHLELACVGSQLTATINDVAVASVEDDTFTSGELTLGVASFDGRTAADARFSNLSIGGASE